MYERRESRGERRHMKCCTESKGSIRSVHTYILVDNVCTYVSLILLITTKPPVTDRSPSHLSRHRKHRNPISVLLHVVAVPMGATPPKESLGVGDLFLNPTKGHATEAINGGIGDCVITLPRRHVLANVAPLVVVTAGRATRTIHFPTISTQV